MKKFIYTFRFYTGTARRKAAKPFSLRVFSSRGIQVILHVAAWLLFFGLVIASSAINRNNSMAEIFSPPFLLFYTTYLFIFYLNEGVLLPRLYLKKKYGFYFAATACLLLGVALLQPFDKIVKGQRESVTILRQRAFEHFHHPPGPPPQEQPPDQPPSPAAHRPERHAHGVDIVSIVLFLTVWAVSMIIALFRQWRLTERRAAQAEIEKANAELSFLKAQINPHFLFNTLNNIYALAVQKNESAPAAIMKLSNIMRYITDEGRQDVVPLQDEVACIADYIALQQLRLTNKTMLHFTTAGAFNTLQIAPLILMPFVENVFKYGVSAHQPSTITITINIAEKTLHFFCLNNLRATQQELERVGIGIENTKARLQHLYPERHTLSLQKEEDTFTVQLTLQL